MAEEFKKDNDYTLSTTTVLKNDGIWKSSLTKIFNFKSAQVTTLYRESIDRNSKYEGGGSYTGPAAALTSQIVIENLRDLPSFEEVKLMHAKLIEMGGTPPELSDVIPIIDKGPGGWMQPR